MSVHFAPFPAGEAIGTQFSVTANGMALPLHEAYVSAMPFNRRWPGYQRKPDQREQVNFALFCMDAPVVLDILPHRSFENVVIRPLSLGIVPTVQDGHIRFSLPRPVYCTVELDGHHGALHIFADPVPTPCPAADENVIYYGPGVHEAGTITLTSGQTLYIDDGAVVYGSVSACNAENIRILGRGILDNSHNVETILHPVDVAGDGNADVGNAVRTHTIELDCCRNIKIEGITIRDSLVYNIRPSGCHDLDISYVKLIGNWRYNSDGIDMHNCRNAHISDCFIRTFDDCICAKGFDFYGGDESIRKNNMRFDGLTVERCVLWNDWNCTLEIGAETYADEMCNITWRDCDIIHATGSFIDGQNVDQAFVHNWYIEDIRCEYDDPAMTPMFQSREDLPYDPQYESGYQPALFSVTVTKHHEYSQTEERGRFKNITLRNISLNAPQKPIVRLLGYDADHRVEDVTIDGIYANGKRLTAEDLDLRVNEYTKNIHIL